MTGKQKKMEQLYFFLMPEETLGFLKHVLGEDTVLLASRSEENSPLVIEPSADVGQSFFCPHNELKNVCMNKAADRVFFLDPAISPVVEFQSSFLREANLSRGRIYFRAGYEGRSGWTCFPDSVYAIYLKAKSLLKETLLTKHREYDAFLSKGAKEYMNSGGALSQT